jgi:hypothetical protein
MITKALKWKDRRAFFDNLAKELHIMNWKTVDISLVKQHASEILNTYYEGSVPRGIQSDELVLKIRYISSIEIISWI